MKLIKAEDRQWERASHELEAKVGVWKKVMVKLGDFLAGGKPQMINWAKLPARSSFAKHHHEDMQEIFMLINGKVKMRVNQEVVELSEGDVIMIDPGEDHQMTNLTNEEVSYVVMGVSLGKGGKTVVV